MNGAPAPGSSEAIIQGCLCPVLDNSYGRGVDCIGGPPQFWVSEGCPLHDAKGKSGDAYFDGRPSEMRAAWLTSGDQ